MPWGAGGCFAFDVRGTFRRGPKPSETTVKAGSARVPPISIVDRLGTFVITADMETNSAIVSLFAETLDKPPAWVVSMPLANSSADKTERVPWRSARLFVSLFAVDDSVCLLDAWSHD